MTEPIKSQIKTIKEIADEILETHKNSTEKFGGAIMGSETSETGNITQGRNEGIIFCTEKPKECAVEYQYIKLKETQK